MNITIIVIAGILAVGLVVYLILKNIKDEEKFEEDVKHSYPINMDENNDIVNNELEERVH